MLAGKSPRQLNKLLVLTFITRSPALRSSSISQDRTSLGDVQRGGKNPVEANKDDCGGGDDDDDLVDHDVSSDDVVR